jgi:hypothetical protein
VQIHEPKLLYIQETNRRSACRIDTRCLDEGMGGGEVDMYNHEAYKKRFEALEQARSEELAHFAAAHHAGSA